MSAADDTAENLDPGLDDERLVSVNFAAEYLDLCKASVHKLIKSGEIESVKIFSSRKLKLGSVKRLANRGMVTGSKAA